MGSGNANRLVYRDSNDYNNNNNNNNKPTHLLASAEMGSGDAD